MSLLTATANDGAYDLTFAQQVYGLGRPGDALLAISTSGKSRNVCNAVIVAKAFGLKSIALTGRSGGELATLADIAIRVPSDNVAEIQELHLPVYHWLSTELEAEFFPV
jgi:D-sedoheptulose 7-phosphate isomerase